MAVTSAQNAYWMDAALTTVTSGNANVTVDDGTTMQTWDGFGGAFNEIGWLALQTLSQSDRDKAIDLLFGADAAHFTRGRIPIGASDYACALKSGTTSYASYTASCDPAASRYSDDETANDTNLDSFSISRDMQALIPYVQAAQAVNKDLTFWASPWTPPTWMKTTSGTANGNNCGLVGSTKFDGGCMVASNMGTYAQYFVKWVQAYGQQNITISMVAPQNEPNYAEGYPSCLWNSADLATFDGMLGSAFSQANLSTQIMLGTNSNGDSGKDSSVVSAIEGNATAKGLVKVIGLQWGMLDGYESNPSSYGSYGIPVWATEHKCGNYPWDPSGSGTNGCGLVSCPSKHASTAPNDQNYGVESWGYIVKAIQAGVTSYNAWNMVLDSAGVGNDSARAWPQDALLSVNTSSKTFTATPAYYAFRHLAQFAQPGAKVIKTTSTTNGGSYLSNLTVAFKNPDGSEVVGMYNPGSAGNWIAKVKNQMYQFAMPSNGWATVVVP